jgi:hypothetical protein
MDLFAYISPKKGELAIAVRRGERPEIYVIIDVGIPNWSTFSIRFPFAEDNPEDMPELIWGALRVLLDDLSAFMLSQSYDEAIITDIYARILATFKGMSIKGSDTEHGRGMDQSIKTYEAEFDLPRTFMNETQKKIVTSAQGIIRRQPPVRQLELTYMKPNKTNPQDAARVIRQFRTKIIRNQPSPLYVLVYNMKGIPVGVAPVNKSKVPAGGQGRLVLE